MSKSSNGTALVTGASGGIGAIYAERLAQRGLDLTLVARSKDRLQENADRIRRQTGRTVHILVADLTRSEDIAAVAERLEKDVSVTLLVNNAGMMLPGAFLDNDAKGTTDLITLNVTAPTLLASAAAKAFLARKRGTIINIGSVVSFLPEMFGGSYGGSKAYILNLSQSLSAQLKDSGVHVQAVLPGPTRTGIWSHNGMDPDAVLPGKIMAAEDLVDAALVGLDAGETVTIPSLPDEALWAQFESSRFAMAPHLAQRDVAARYRVQNG
ncbi:MAG: SDR family oxidoreductase [Azospirillaceae bacterium]|nr:SDR family oxidoreductase [Azospirillaceae bacterium]